MYGYLTASVLLGVQGARYLTHADDICFEESTDTLRFVPVQPRVVVSGNSICLWALGRQPCLGTG